MSLHNLNTTITPAEHSALMAVVSHAERWIGKVKKIAQEERKTAPDWVEELDTEIEFAKPWLSAVSEKFFTEWDMLPEGSHLKKAYEDQVWTWSDRDLAAMPSTEPTDIPERPGA